MTDPMYEVPLSRLKELSAAASATAQRTAISTEERRHLIVDAVERLRDRGVMDISMNAITVAIDGTLEKLGVRVADDLYANDGIEDAPASDGTPVCPHCGGQGVEFLTDEERGFFAYMASQRWRTVAEKDMRLAEEKRSRWQSIARWFDPGWKPE